MIVVVLGAGGHGEVVADAVRASVGPSVRIIFLDDALDRQGRQLPDGAVEGLLGAWPAYPGARLLSGIGDNRTRARICDAVPADFLTVVHPRAWVAGHAAVGSGTVVIAGAVVNTGARIGRHVIINTSASVDHHCVVEDFAHVAPGARLGGDVRIGLGAFIGIGASILPGRKVGAWATVGSGAVVLEDVGAGTTVVGNPARLVLPASK